MLLIIDVPSPSGINISKKITIKDFFENIPSNTNITGNLVVDGDIEVTGNTDFGGYTANVVVGSDTLIFVDGLLKDIE